MRYGRLMLMTDGDADGAHIKGLVSANEPRLIAEIGTFLIRQVAHTFLIWQVAHTFLIWQVAHTFLIWQVLSMFAHLFPDLLARSFVDEFVTPLVKCTKGKSEKAFYTQVVMNHHKLF